MMHASGNLRRIQTLSSWRQFCFRSITILIALVAALFPTLSVGATGWSEYKRMHQFSEAAEEFNVPKEILLAVSYNETRWENHDGEPSERGGFGLMHLTSSKAQTEEGKTGDEVKVAPENREFTLDKAAKLLGVDEDSLKKDDMQNLRGGAAVLANYQASFNTEAHVKNHHKKKHNLEKWYLAVARYADAADAEGAKEFIKNVYATIESGEKLTTTDGQKMELKAHRIDLGPLNIDALKLRSRNDTTTADCPTGLTCDFAPAAHVQNSDDPKDYGNYDFAKRPNDMKVKYIVIHDTEGSYDSARAHFQDPKAYVSAHYLIRSNDGQVTQMVRNNDVAWHAGNWYMNMHSIGIEHEGFAAEGATWYTEQMYQSSAKLVKYLAEKYGIPLDREHILGHSEYLTNDAKTAHTDPGPFWDWERYMQLIKGDVHTMSTQDNKHNKKHDWHRSQVAQITPRFLDNKPAITQCTDGTCTNLPSQSANFVYVYSKPEDGAPLITDAGLHEDGTPGTTEINDTSAKAVYGQRFTVAGKQGNWLAIWFNGQKGWIKDSDVTTTPVKKALSITPNSYRGASLYAMPYPEGHAYPSSIEPREAVKLPYKMQAWQKYTVNEQYVPNDYFYALTFDRSAEDDGMVVIGKERYIPVWFNHRQGFVKAHDVKTSH
jgi:N-acetyl-anhydromuramyl-L-alanine amidase AmpD